MRKNPKINFLPYLLSAILGLSLYFLIYLPIEFLMTEVLFVIPKINPWISTNVLFFFLIIANLFDFKKIIKERKKMIFLLAFFLVNVAFYGVYHQLKLSLEYLPKIYQIKPSWVIQGQSLEIRGVNFGFAFNKGKVMVDGMEFLARYWDENMVIAEAPVPSKEGKFPLSIKTKEGKVSNILILEVKDPDFLKKYLK